MKFISLITSSVLLVAAFLAQDVETSPIEKRVPSCYNGGKITFTQYWIPKEGTTDMDNNGKTLSLTGPKTDDLKSSGGGVIATVDKNTHAKCKMEGTCLVDGGKLVNLVSGDSYEVVSASQFPWGLGNWDNPLEPFVSVASNDWSQGQTAVVKELVGKKLPNGKTHNGCVRVDDKGWSFGSCQFDFFILEYPWYDELNLPDKVTATQQDCEVGNYVTSDMKDWMGRGGDGGNTKTTTKTKTTTTKTKTTTTKTTKTTKTKTYDTETDSETRTKTKTTKTTKTWGHWTKTKTRHHGWNDAEPTEGPNAINTEFVTTSDAIPTPTDAPGRNFKVNPHKSTTTTKTRSHLPTKTNRH